MPDASVVAAAVGGLAGLLTGTVSSLVAPWVTHGLERKKAEREQRQERIREWRTGFGQAAADDRIENSECLHDPWYLSLRPYLSDKAVEIIEFGRDSRVFTVVGGFGKHRGKKEALLLAAIDHVAEEWGVV